MPNVLLNIKFKFLAIANGDGQQTFPAVIAAKNFMIPSGGGRIWRGYSGKYQKTAFAACWRQRALH